MRLLMLLGFSSTILLGLLTVLGISLDPSRESTHSAYLTQKPAEVFALLEKPRQSSEWRPSVQYVEMSGERGVRETYQRGTKVEYEMKLDPKRFEIALESLKRSDGFLGQWQIEVNGMDGGTFLTVTEKGRISNPILRTVDHFFVGRHYWVKLFLEEVSERMDSKIKGRRYEEPALPLGI